MTNRQILAMMVLFVILAVALNSIVFTDDRTVAKLAMFAMGVAIGTILPTTVIMIRRGNNA